MWATSLLAISCASHVEAGPPAAARKVAAAHEGPAEDTIRATFEALVAEKQLAKKHFERGKQHFAAGEFENALIEFRKALELSPGDPEYRKKVRAAEQALGKMPNR